MPRLARQDKRSKKSKTLGEPEVVNREDYEAMELTAGWGTPSGTASRRPVDRSSTTTRRPASIRARTVWLPILTGATGDEGFHEVASCVFFRTRQMKENSRPFQTTHFSLQGGMGDDSQREKPC